ncbi:hypothetical protein [Pseudomonas aeruginosa]|uniref:hypothetical protein n=1 Tax=Pseudomonas aeruginosa TaxID=287 RepID=UPI0018E2A680|nr:hypothetical protein [Pseudomonas aeruginosa]MBX5700381.1 hypothetical protein [Pseudomonas aeruginosa]MDA3168818.1 hypothetical protein [Pseudomonas aeruginosa]MDU0680276.1 hypothetical protein [Pseudomonas aeruginosa]QQD35970.1 hypothetical protein HUF09_29150 [Pseudomonas aeruginosa]UJB87466.1 hypothetical protein HUK64_19220 [Pseudomonas aeruginosa]
MLRQRMEVDEWIASIPAPAIETWLNLPSGPVAPRLRKRAVEYEVAAAGVRTDELLKTDEAFRRFYNAVLGSLADADEG